MLETFAKTESAQMKRRVARYLVSTDCPACRGKRLRPEALSVTFAGLDIADMSRQPLKRLAEIFRPYAAGRRRGCKKLEAEHPEKARSPAASREDLERPARRPARPRPRLPHARAQHADALAGRAPAAAAGTQVRSNLFGVVYVLDEPSAGLHPADTEALLRALDRLKAAGNSLFVVEHELDVIRHADWIVDVGPDAGRARRPRALQRAARRARGR